MSLYADRIARIDTENAFKIGPHIRRQEEAGRRVIKCNLGEPDFGLADYIKDEIKRQLDKDNIHYTDPKGILSFRRAIARQINETRGLDVTPEHVVVFPGAKPPIGFSCLAYVNEGEEVIYPSPGFPIYESFVTFIGAVPRPLHLQESKGFSFSAEDLEPLITDRTKLIILNFPSNPTGGVASEEQLRGIAELIRRKCRPDVRVYSDEVYECILFDGARHLSIASLPGMRERTIIVSGHSKTFSWTGGRIGYAVFPTVEEADAFKNLNINVFSCVPPFLQEGAREALENEKRHEVVGGMVRAFQERRDVVVKALNEIPGVTCCNPTGAFYVFPNIGGALQALGALDLYESLDADRKRRTTPATMFQMYLLYRFDVACMDRRSFGRLGSEGKHFLRLSIATGMEDLKEAVARIGTALSDRDAFRRWFEAGENLWS
jgi:aspartate/methionine/tyrosine aminotransferase